MPKTVGEQMDKIRRSVGLVTPQMLENVWGNMTRCLKKTVDMRGYDHIENFKI